MVDVVLAVSLLEVTTVRLKHGGVAAVEGQQVQVRGQPRDEGGERLIDV